jgi:O-methyltransferase involved in polyketide biosynthesis
MTRDWASISPSAKAILLVRSQTSLPYAREAAELLFGAEAVARAAADTSDGVLLRRVHFERRARSVDDALAAVAPTRILELAAGLSFRGLAAVEKAAIQYVDTDLPEMAAIKQSLLPRLSKAPRSGTLRVEALNALDQEALTKTVATMSDGPLAIVNEGLLMYLDDEEKRRLATNVRHLLVARGGVWITADIYVRTTQTIFRDEKTKAFAFAHGIDEKKFATFDAAETFFTENGFAIQSRAGNPTRETWTLIAS